MFNFEKLPATIIYRNYKFKQVNFVDREKLIK